MAMILRGWANPQVEDGIAEIQHALDMYRQTGQQIIIPYYLALQAELYGKSGRFDEGLGLLREAQETAERNHESWWDAELCRLTGELTLKRRVQRPDATSQENAEKRYLQAIEIASRQGAKSLHLRATLSLCRLRQDQGRRTEAQYMLATVRNSFVSRLDTRDIQEAKTMLEQLNNVPT